MLLVVEVDLEIEIEIEIKRYPVEEHELDVVPVELQGELAFEVVVDLGVVW